MSKDPKNCSCNTGGISVMYAVAISDLKIKDGQIIGLKRKYGNFKRPVAKFNYKEHKQ